MVRVARERPRSSIYYQLMPPAEAVRIGDRFALHSIAALIRMKLASLREIDRMDVADLMSAGADRREDSHRAFGRSASAAGSNRAGRADRIEMLRYSEVWDRLDAIRRTVIVLLVVFVHIVVACGILIASIAESRPGYFDVLDFRRVFFGLFLLLLIDIGWLAWRRQVRARRTAASDTCQKCGYLLIGNVTGVCPECGQATYRPAGAVQLFRE